MRHRCKHLALPKNTFTHTKNSTDASISPDGKQIALSKAGYGFEVYALHSDFTNTVCDMKTPSTSTQKFPLPVQFAHHDLAVMTGGYDNDATLWLVSDPAQHQRFSTIRA